MIDELERGPIGIILYLKISKIPVNCIKNCGKGRINKVSRDDKKVRLIEYGCYLFEINELHVEKSTANAQEDVTCNKREGIELPELLKKGKIDQVED
jgi:hypothetical protein